MGDAEKKEEELKGEELLGAVGGAPSNELEQEEERIMWSLSDGVESPHGNRFSEWMDFDLTSMTTDDVLILDRTTTHMMLPSNHVEYTGAYILGIGHLSSDEKQVMYLVDADITKLKRNTSIDIRTLCDPYQKRMRDEFVRWEFWIRPPGANPNEDDDEMLGLAPVKEEEEPDAKTPDTAVLAPNHADASVSLAELEWMREEPEPAADANRQELKRDLAGFGNTQVPAPPEAVATLATGEAADGPTENTPASDDDCTICKRPKTAWGLFECLHKFCRACVDELITIERRRQRRVIFEYRIDERYLSLTCALCRRKTLVTNLRHVVNGTNGDTDYPAVIVPYEELEQIYDEAMGNEDGNLIVAIDSGAVEIEDGVIVFYSPEGERVLPDGPEYNPRYNPRPVETSSSRGPALAAVQLPMGLPSAPVNTNPNARAGAAGEVNAPAVGPSAPNHRGASRRGGGAARPNSLRIPSNGRARNRSPPRNNNNNNSRNAGRNRRDPSERPGRNGRPNAQGNIMIGGRWYNIHTNARNLARQYAATNHSIGGNVGSRDHSRDQSRGLSRGRASINNSRGWNNNANRGNRCAQALRDDSDDGDDDFPRVNIGRGSSGRDRVGMPRAADDATRETTARAHGERVAARIIAGFRSLNLGHQNGQHDAVMEGVDIRTHLHLFAAVFALWELNGGANLHFGSPPTWRPIAMRGRVLVEFDTRFKAAYHLLQKYVRDRSYTSPYGTNEHAHAQPRPVSLTTTDFSFWDKLMATTSYRNEISMLRVADYVMRHLAVTMVLRELGVTSEVATRGSLRGPFPNWIPSWAEADDCVHGNFFSSRLHERLRETRDLAWRIIQRMNALNQIFHPVDGNWPAGPQEDEESQDEYNFLDEDD